MSGKEDMEENAVDLLKKLEMTADDRSQSHSKKNEIHEAQMREIFADMEAEKMMMPLTKPIEQEKSEYQHDIWQGIFGGNHHGVSIPLASGHGKEQFGPDPESGIVNKGQYHKTFATIVLWGLQIIILAAQVFSMNNSLGPDMSDHAKMLWLFLLGCTMASIPFWLYGFLLSGLKRCIIAARVVTGIGYIATVFGLISALGLLLPQEFMLGGTASVCIICLPGLIANAIYGNDKHSQTIVVWGGQIISVAAAVFSKNNSPEMSPNAKILWRFLLGCTFTSIPFRLYGSLLGGLHNGVAARAVIGIGYIATVFGLISALGLLLPDELMLWSTASACIICLPALICYAMKW